MGNCPIGKEFLVKFAYKYFMDFFSNFFLKYSLLLCVHAHAVCVSLRRHVPLCTHGSQRMALRSRLSPSTVESE